MCPRCNSTQQFRSDDPEYHHCLYCGPVFIAENTLPYMLQDPRMPKISRKDPKNYSSCADCGVEIEARSKRCKNCAGKGARV